MSKFIRIAIAILVLLLTTGVGYLIYDNAFRSEDSSIEELINQAYDEYYEDYEIILQGGELERREWSGLSDHDIGQINLIMERSDIVDFLSPHPALWDMENYESSEEIWNSARAGNEDALFLLRTLRVETAANYLSYGIDFLPYLVMGDEYLLNLLNEDDPEVSFFIATAIGIEMDNDENSASLIAYQEMLFSNAISGGLDFVEHSYYYDRETTREEQETLMTHASLFGFPNHNIFYYLQESLEGENCSKVMRFIETHYAHLAPHSRARLNWQILHLLSGKGYMQLCGNIQPNFFNEEITAEDFLLYILEISNSYGATYIIKLLSDPRISIDDIERSEIINSWLEVISILPTSDEQLHWQVNAVRLTRNRISQIVQLITENMNEEN